MSFDNSRFTFDPWKDYSGVVMEQGRVQTDADWNEWLAELSRRIRAGTLDTMGHAVYPQTTPNAFKIAAATSGSTNSIQIGLGRMYVDGILVENHGPQNTATWDSALAELSNTPQPQPTTPQTLNSSNSIDFKQQQYNPGAVVPPGPGEYLAYLDVWQRPITFIEDSSLIDPAIGIDTTGRLQTAWRVGLMPLPAVSVAGGVTSGSFHAGDQVTQATSGATAVVLGTVPSSGPMMLTRVTGSPDATHVWSNTSGGQFTPAAAPTGLATFIQGSVASGTFQSGETVVQSGSGASATLSEAVPSSEPMILGPLSGTPAPFAPWIGQTSGAVFHPTALPGSSSSSISGSVSSGTFIANEEVVQSTTGVSANVIGIVPSNGPMLVGPITGTPDANDSWVGKQSKATFAPAGAPTPSSWSCSTPDSSLPWPSSSGTLSTQPASSSQSGPCCLTTGSGYTGQENQFYRIEIHTAGGAGATFKWSRENASVQTAVTAISPASNSLGAPTSALTVQSLGRDQVLSFAAGNWIEITDQTHDDNCLPGELYKIDFVDVATSTITLTTPLSANFTSATLAANTYTRIIRWDQSGQVYKVVAGTQQPYYNLDAASASGAPNGCAGIPVPTDGSPIVLENGIAIVLALSPTTGSFQPMDYWNFTARTATGTFDTLTNASPRGVAHHYTKLSIVTFTGTGSPGATDCRTPWPPTSGGEGCGCCCTCTVGDGVNSFGAFTSIQAAVNSLQHGGEVCILPGDYYEHVLIESMSNVKIHGCGERTRVFSPSFQPGAAAGSSAGSGSSTLSSMPAVFTIVGSQNIELCSFSVIAADGEVGILVDRAAALNNQTLAEAARFRITLNSYITLAELEISASTLPAIAAREVLNFSACENRIAMRNVANLFPAVYLAGDEIHFDRNHVTIASANAYRLTPVARQVNQAGANVDQSAAVFTNQNIAATLRSLAVGGVQVAGPSMNVWVVENVIEGGSRNGITLGNIIYLNNNGNDSGKLIGVITTIEDPCSKGASGSIPSSTSSGGSQSVPVAAGGEIRNLHILRNKIRSVGMCGIGPVDFFDLKTTSEIVSLVNVLIAENILANTITRAVVEPAASVSPYGYGAISLPDVQNLIICDNIISDYGVLPGAPVSGIYVYHGEGIEIDRNHIRESRDLTAGTTATWTTYGGRRAGIYIELATPPTLDTSSNSLWTKSIAEYTNVAASDTFRYQPPQYAPGFSALRITNNDVRVAFGLALAVLGTGPFSILGNHFSTGGTVTLNSVDMRAFNLQNPNITAVGTTAGALTVAIANLGLAVEAFDLLESYSELIKATSNSTSQTGESLSVTNGTVLFSNNTCQLMAQLNKVHGLCSVGILTLDHLLFSNNELWLNGRAECARLDAYLLGMSVQAISNRLQESLRSVIDSGFSFGLLNVTSQNLSTYCFLSSATKPQWWVHSPNVVINHSRCADALKG